jgi:hypothetical protein
MMIDVDEETAGSDILYHPIRRPAIQKNADIANIVPIKRSLDMLDSRGKEKMVHNRSCIIQTDRLAHVLQEKVKSELGTDTIPIRPNVSTHEKAFLLLENLSNLPDNLFKFPWINLGIIFIILPSHVSPFQTIVIQIAPPYL